MSDPNPILAVRVAANLDELRKNLKEGITQIETTKTTLQSMSNSFDGSRTINQAGAVMAQIMAMGGVTKLTTAEQAKANRTLDEALEKYRAMGREAPPGMLSLEEATRRAVVPANDLHRAFSQFDSLLASMGIHLGPEVKGLAELGTAAGQTVGQLGMIATAGLAVGAGIGGWKIGRAVAEFLGLDDIIGRATAKLLGFGDVAAQTAGANADKLAEASRRAGHEITDLGVATAILTAGLAENRTFAQQSADVLKVWHGEIARVKSAGELAALTKDIKDQVFTLDDLAKRYHVSVAALQAFKQETANAAQVEQAANAIISKNNSERLQMLAHEVAANKEAAKLKADSLLAITKLEDEYTALRVQHGGTANQAAIAQIVQWASDVEAQAKKAGIATKAFYDALAKDSAEKMAGVGIDWDVFRTRSIAALQETEQNARRTYDAMVNSGMFFRDELDQQRRKWEDARDAARGYGKDAVAAQEAAAAATKKHNDELDAQRKKVEELAAINRAMGGSTQYDLSTQEGRAKVPPDIAMYLHDGYSFEQASRLAYAMKMGFDVSRDPLFAQRGPRVPGFATGVQDAPGGWAVVGERGPETMYVPPHANIYPAGTPPPASVGGGTQVIQLVVDGRVLASIVNDHNTKSMRQRRQWPGN